MYSTENNKQVAKVTHSKSLTDVAVCYGTSFRISTNPLKYKDVSANKMAMRIAKALNMLDKIENTKLNSLTKAQLLDVINFK